jgi:hypothetical protein
MKLIFAPMMIGMLAIAGISPAAAQSKPATDKSTSVGAATTKDTLAERNSFTRQAQEETRLWEQRLHDFDAKVKVKATAAETSASKELDAAWAETKKAASQLETAGEKDWGSAKASFRTASDKLAATWHKVNPADK